ncbi:MAG: YIP1 family protein [Pseudomonadota bacterium]
MSVTRDIVKTYRTPRAVLRRHLDGPKNEGRVLAYLMLGCLLIFVAQWPRLSREAYLDPSVPLDARIGGALMGWIFIAPIFFYFIAWISHGLTRVFGGKGSSYGARVALFWALLAVSPLWLLHGLASGFLGGGPQLALLGLPLLALFVVFWFVGLREAATEQSLEGKGGTP